MSARMGIYQEVLYKAYGKHPQEALYYTVIQSYKLNECFNFDKFFCSASSAIAWISYTLPKYLATYFNHVSIGTCVFTDSRYRHTNSMALYYRKRSDAVHLH